MRGDRSWSPGVWLPPYLIWLLVVASIISWRQGVIFDGGVDTVVVGKASVAGAAAIGAVVAATSAPRRRKVGGLSLGFVAMIVAISTLGAYAENELSSAAVLAARIGLLATTILFIIAANSTVTVIATLLAAMASIGLVAGAAGVGTLVAEGRLSGGFPPLAPNELAGLLLPPLIGLFFVMVSSQVRAWSSTLFVVLLATIYLTGSRTGLATLALALALVVVLSPQVSRGVVAATLVAVPVAYVLVGFTDVISQVISRGEETSKLLTLNSRTVAWEAVLSIPSDTWRWWIGSGLALKVIPVDERFRDEQVLDSSWISSLAQSGVIGTALLAALVICALVGASRPGPLRALFLPLLALITVRSILENGLVESSPTFALFFTIAVLIEKNTSELLQVTGRPIGLPSRKPRSMIVPWLSADRSS